jgi:hypothetical protein
MKRFIAVTMLLAAFATSAFANELPPGKWWRRPELARMLELSQQQQEKLDVVFREAATELIDIKADVDKLSIAMRSELDRAQLNRQEIQNLAGKLNAARGRMFSRELMMLVDMRAVLNDAQWSRLRSELEKRREQGERMNDRQRPMDGGPPMGQPNGMGMGGNRRPGARRQ